MKLVNRTRNTMNVYGFEGLRVTNAVGQVVDDWFKRRYGRMRLGTAPITVLVPQEPYVVRMDFALPGPGSYRLTAGLPDSQQSSPSVDVPTLETTVVAR
jgi:hypothetical protein